MKTAFTPIGESNYNSQHLAINGIFMKQQGFSLIELMLVMIVIAVFASFTYPSYRESITRARRLDGQTALFDLASRMEQFYAKEQSYEGATLGSGAESDVLSSKYSPQNWYTLVIKSQSDSEFSLQAIPQGAQAENDQSCRILGFDSHGIKSKTGNSGAKCW